MSDYRFSANLAQYMALKNIGNSMYGPGVLNDTIVPGYGVTKFPVNLDTFWSLPNGTTRNFGEATQYVTYPMGHPNFMYQLAQNSTDPNHISNWNPMLIGMNLTDNIGTNPSMTQMGQSSAYQWGQNLRIQQEIQSAIQGIAGALNSMESSLSNIIKSDNLTNAQKAELAGLLEEVKALKSKIEQQLKAKNPTQDEVIDMQKEVQDLQKKVSEAADKIRAEVNEAGNGSSASSGSSSSSSSDSSSSSSSDPADLSGTEYENIDPETGRHTSIGEAPSKSECRQFCATIFDAIDGCGTKNDVIEATVPGLTAANIVEVISYWDKNYGSGDQGMIRRLIDDLGHYEKKKYVPMLLNALQTRAEALGIDDEIDQYVTNITKELGDCNISDGICSKNLMAIYDKIVEKEAANKEGAKKALDGKKTEHNSAVGQRRQEVITEKKNEIANKLKEALKLKETPALAAGLNVETDDNGEFTGYSIKLNTQNGEVTAKGCTYQQLALEIEKKGLKVEDVLIRKTQA